MHTLLTRHLAPGAPVIVGDVACPTTALRAQAREHYQDRWDDEEHYFAADELRGRLEPRGVTVAYRQISPCAGLLICELRRTSGSAVAGP